MFFEPSSLKEIIEGLRQTLPKGLAANKRHLVEMYGVSAALLQHVLGADWTDRHVRPVLGKGGYFGIGENTERAIAQHMMRTWQLAELIYNLYYVENFGTRLDDIRDRGAEGVESAIAELIGGMFFKSQGVSFRFVPESGVKQGDYDIDYRRNDGEVGRCEAKCKLDTTELGPKTIVNTLQAARAQLPKGKASIVLLRIPWGWRLENETFQDVVTEGVNQFFARDKTTRISHVITYVSETMLLEDWTIGHTLFTVDHENPYCQQSAGLTLSQASRPLYDENWLPLMRELEIAESCG